MLEPRAQRSAGRTATRHLRIETHDVPTALPEDPDTRAGGSPGYDAFARYASGVTLVAGREAGEDRFLVAASVLTASVEPFTLAVSVGRGRDALPALLGPAPWSLGVLAEPHRPLVAGLTGETTRSQRHDALLGAGARTSPEGPLWLPDALVTFWCRTRSTLEVHDQVILVGEVERSSALLDGRPLLRWDHTFRTVQPPLG